MASSSVACSGSAFKASMARCFSVVSMPGSYHRQIHVVSRELPVQFVSPTCAMSRGADVVSGAVGSIARLGCVTQTSGRRSSRHLAKSRDPCRNATTTTRSS
jgi:hypothetical protein